MASFQIEGLISKQYARYIRSIHIPGDPTKPLQGLSKALAEKEVYRSPLASKSIKRSRDLCNTSVSVSDTKKDCKYESTMAQSLVRLLNESRLERIRVNTDPYPEVPCLYMTSLKVVSYALCRSIIKLKEFEINLLSCNDLSTFYADNSDRVEFSNDHGWNYEDYLLHFEDIEQLTLNIKFDDRGISWISRRTLSAMPKLSSLKICVDYAASPTPFPYYAFEPGLRRLSLEGYFTNDAGLAHVVLVSRCLEEFSLRRMCLDPQFLEWSEVMRLSQDLQHLTILRCEMLCYELDFMAMRRRKSARSWGEGCLLKSNYIRDHQALKQLLGQVMQNRQNRKLPPDQWLHDSFRDMPDMQDGAVMDYMTEQQTSLD